MILTLLAASLAIMVRSLVAFRLERWNIGAPVLMVLAGVGPGLSSRARNDHQAQASHDGRCRISRCPVASQPCTPPRGLSSTPSRAP
jgi:hypothetical protein